MPHMIFLVQSAPISTTKRTRRLPPKVWNTINHTHFADLLPSIAGFIPGDPGAFAVQLSERLADFIPSMTLDFISEVAEGMGDIVSQRISCLQYLSPWVK